jgi:hypothetical protein
MRALGNGEQEFHLAQGRLRGGQSGDHQIHPAAPAWCRPGAQGARPGAGGWRVARGAAQLFQQSRPWPARHCRILKLENLRRSPDRQVRRRPEMSCRKMPVSAPPGRTSLPSAVAQPKSRPPCAGSLALAMKPPSRVFDRGVGRHHEAAALGLDGRDVGFAGRCQAPSARARSATWPGRVGARARKVPRRSGRSPHAERACGALVRSPRMLSRRWLACP